MFGWPFKRSSRQVLRDNKARGDEGERLVKSKYQIAGYDVERTGRGSDYKVSRKNWFAGKKDTTLLEVKTGNAKLSPLQKKRKRSWGKRYVVERVPNSPLSQPVSSATQPAQKKGRGKSSLPSKSFRGSSSPGGSKRGRKSPSILIWGPSSGKRKPSVW